jgi:transcriptional regulator with XRE-family HTH domain
VTATRCQRDDGKITAITPIDGNGPSSTLKPGSGWAIMRLTLSSCTRRGLLAQARCACIINLVENNQVAPGIERPDPEVQAGRALRRLRLSQGWSQEEVARHMEAYGYGFHQTMIAKIEAAQRPLRVRELADFAALYGVEVHELLYPPTGSLADIDQEIAKVEAQYQAIHHEAAAAAERLHQVQAALAQAEEMYRAHSTDAVILRERLIVLQKERVKLQEEREKLARWEADDKPAPSDAPGSPRKPDPFAATTPAEFTAALRRYRLWAGGPAFSQMAAHAEHRVAATAMNAAMNGKALPKLDVVKAIITGCGGSEDDLQAFATAWRRITLNGAERPAAGTTLFDDPSGPAR